VLARERRHRYPASYHLHRVQKRYLRECFPRKIGRPQIG
jgi:hypothetical protein